MMNQEHRCRICLGGTEEVLTLTPTPIANSYPEHSDIYAPRFPLGVLRCKGCGHCQVSYEIEGSALYSDYRYETPVVERIRLARYAEKLKLDYGNANILEIGSNNGIFLEELRRVGFNAQGIDPASPQRGLPKYFDSKTAKVLEQTFGRFDLVLANNVFAHVDDLRNVVLGVTRVLTPAGRFIFEVQYAPDMVAGGMFDMIYHEHKDYHTLSPLPFLLKKFGMCIEKIDRLNTHGGSIRVYAKFGDKGIKLSDPAIDWESFSLRIQSEKARILTEISRYGKVAAFGATAKACTLIHHFGLQDKIAYCIDETPSKQSRYIAGTGIQIMPWEHLKSDPPEAIFLTAWNYVAILKPRFSVPVIVPFERVENRVAA